MSILYTALATVDSEDVIAHLDLPNEPAFPHDAVRSANSFHVVTLTSMGGAGGTTTSAVALATMLRLLSDGHLRVAVLDLNLRHPALFYITKDATVNFVSLSDADEYSLEYIESRKLTTSQGFDCYTLFGDSEPSNSKERQNLIELFKQLRELYDVIILDTDSYPSHSPYTLLALQESDIVLCVSQCDEMSLNQLVLQAKELLLPLNEGGVGLRKSTTGALLNRSSSDLLTVHRLTKRVREIIPVVGAIPVLPHASDTNHQFRLIRANKDLHNSMNLIFKNVFAGYSFEK